MVLYPRVPFDSVRTRFIAGVRAAYARLGEDWFRTHNHHMNPELFDSAIDPTVIVGAKGSTLAFVVHFGDAQAPAATPEMDVVVVCSRIKSDKPACREADLAVVRRARPGLSRTALLAELAAGGHAQ
jgi:hypothetical protein